MLKHTKKLVLSLSLVIGWWVCLDWYCHCWFFASVCVKERERERREREGGSKLRTEREREEKKREEKRMNE